MTDPELAVGVINPFWTWTARLAVAHTVLMLVLMQSLQDFLLMYVTYSMNP